MTVGSEDRRRMAVIARSLAAIETDEVPPTIERTLAEIDADRVRRGLKPLERNETHPEEELYRRARALGLRIGRS